MDIGGTFTDLCAVEDGRIVAVGKTLTTPEDPAEAVEKVVRETLADLDAEAEAIDLLVHGTTLVTNAIIERKGVRTALFATHGFRDALEIGRERRYELYDLMVEQPQPLVPRHLRFDVPERTLADGAVAVPLDVEYVERLVDELVDTGVSAVAISFLHSFMNPAHELRAREAVLRKAPQMQVSISSEVAGQIREYERTSTTVANVYVQPIVDRYLRDLEDRLRRAGFVGRIFVMLSSGGIATLETARRFPIRLVESGPAAGALAAARHGAETDTGELLSFDMGGTTAKLCLIENGQPLLSDDFEVDRVYRFRKGSGLPIKVPVIDMIEVGVGGGSIARVDALGLLKVGPDSAGAAPGPACYGLGGRSPTVTDADLVLGYLDPNYFLGGKMRLDVDAARDAIDREVASSVGVSVEEAAWGIHQIVNENMANAARVHAVERGKNPSLLPLFAFGGAGPVHAVGVAASLGVSAVVVPHGAGVMSSVGFLAAPLAFDFVRSWRCEIEQLDLSRAEALLCEMEEEGRELLASAGLEDESMRHTRYADMRYVGQGHEVRVEVLRPLTDAALLAAEFERVYRVLYGKPGPPVPVEALDWRIVSSGPTQVLRLTGAQTVGAAGAQQKGSRPAYFLESRRYVVTPVFDRYALPTGFSFDGPAIVEERESTLVVRPGQSAHVAPERAIVVELKPAGIPR